MSLFVYNGVTLPYLLTTQFRQEAVYDPSQTDWHLIRLDLTVQFLLNVNYLDIIVANPEDEDPVQFPGNMDNAAQIMALLRARLLRPRRQLRMTFNGIDLIPSTSGNRGHVDAKNGPQPQHCNPIQLSNETFLVEYRIVAHYFQNRGISLDPNTYEPRAVLLYNRWSETADIDSRNFTTRTREGTYAIRSDNKPGKIADEIRADMAMLGVPDGFNRVSSHYTVTPDGLAIQYRVVDRELFKQPPSPAYEADGSYTETTPYRGGTVRFGEVRVHLKGAKDTDQGKLIKTAVAVAASKLLIAGAERSSTQGIGLLDYSSITQQLYENEVEVRLRAQLAPRVSSIAGTVFGGPAIAALNAKARTNGIAGVNFNNMARTPFSDGVTNYKPQYPIRGTAGYLLQAAAYYDPSLRGVAIEAVQGQLNEGVEIGRAGKEGEEGNE